MFLLPGLCDPVADGSSGLKKILLIGLGGGALPTYIHRHIPMVRSTGLGQQLNIPSHPVLVLLVPYCTRRTLPNNRLIKIGGRALTQGWALARDNTVLHSHPLKLLIPCSDLSPLYSPLPSPRFPWKWWSSIPRWWRCLSGGLASQGQRGRRDWQCTWVKGQSSSDSSVQLERKVRVILKFLISEILYRVTSQTTV